MRSIAVCAGTIILILSAAGPNVAAKPKSAPSAAAASKDEKVDPDAMAALDKMGAELRSHQTFALKADTTNEDVLGDGQKLQYQSTVDMQARRPDRFRIEINSDLRNRAIYYDGKTVTVFSPRLGYYASFDAPPTIRETLQQASAKYGVEIPLSDMFAWGTD